MPFNRYNTNRGYKAAGPWKFLMVFLGVFFLFAVFLFAIDFVPEAPGQNASATIAEAAGNTVSLTSSVPLSQAAAAEEPVRISIPKVGINAIVSNPSSTDTDVLDNALLKGAVRYPKSALLGENASVYLFGHQSYLPVVHNQAFKAFNGLQNLKSGDEIDVFSATTKYQYRVRSVELVDASDTDIALDSRTPTLILTTCDSFGTKSQRYEVQADLIAREPVIASS